MKDLLFHLFGVKLFGNSTINNVFFSIKREIILTIRKYIIIMTLITRQVYENRNVDYAEHEAVMQ